MSSDLIEDKALELTNTQVHFHLQEYKALRDEQITTMTEMSRHGQFFLIAEAALIAWLLAGAGQYAAQYAAWTGLVLAWIPFAFAILMQAHLAQLRQNALGLGSYLQLLERTLGFSELGWERATSENRIVTGHMRRSYRRIYGAVFVATLLLGVTLTISILSANGEVDSLAAHLSHEFHQGAN